MTNQEHSTSNGTQTVQELHLLASLLGEPTEESLPLLEEIAPQLPWLSDAALEQLRETPLEEWQAEHTRLFISGRPHTECVPFESVWREGQMIGESAMALKRLYDAFGFTPDAELPADFLGSELECLAFALTHHADKEETLVELLEHLHGWIPKFAKAVRIHAELELYRDWAKRLEALFA
ncbi:respiratory nitrate reductase chaperone NarJ [Sulfurivirga caldicuralii]|uniref:Respiratory nitrate reductase chaperone NarJ n=1 Tax=Sulfurivirga caldicuralii TaxID=364032 RepID=A0A1N6DJU2_9GAMM|nr:molecular chaperone TorD family protein [Sulfurivirga caldicuralii]SIN70943.1 respiratory nitrate reductase chaperone NarJ [Sulfurivirga caldicuralii]